MGFLDIIAILFILYYFITILIWCVADCDIELFIKSYLGLPVSSLRGKVVWITGASSGIGRSLAIELSQHGVKLVLSARRGDVLESVKIDCLAHSAGALQSQDILVLPMDMLNIDSHQIYFDKVLRHFNSVDILVNNAGRSQRAKWIDINLAVDKEVFELDVFSVVNLTRIVVKHFLSFEKKGIIAVTSSTAGLIGIPNSASYSGAKFAIHGYFEALRIECWKKINVCLFCPGPTATNFLQNCFTSKEGETYGQTIHPSDKRITSERCAHLFAIQIANKIDVAWAGVFPINILTYVSLYLPNIKKFALLFVDPNKFGKIRDSNVVNI